MILKDANRVDPDQTAPSEAKWPGSTLFDQISLSHYLDFNTQQHKNPKNCCNYPNSEQHCFATEEWVQKMQTEWQTA